MLIIEQTSDLASSQRLIKIKHKYEVLYYGCCFDGAVASNNPKFVFLIFLSGKLDPTNIVQILDALVKQGHVEWQDPRKKSCLIMWRTPEEWGKLVYDWVWARAKYYKLIRSEVGCYHYALIVVSLQYYGRFVKMSDLSYYSECTT